LQFEDESRALARFFFEYGDSRYRAVIGVDEVGRGCLFGPVTVGAVLISERDWERLGHETWYSTVTDSKKLSAKKRETLAPLLRARVPHAVSHVSVKYIDTYNINRAVQFGIYRAVQRLLAAVSIAAAECRVIVDGNYRFLYPGLRMQKLMPRVDAEIKADLKYFPVSAASIIAKVERDAMISRAAQRFPGYGLEAHAGYGTQQHREAIRRLGQSRFHRKSFKLRNG
jgi:ribonuclease HII